MNRKNKANRILEAAEDMIRSIYDIETLIYIYVSGDDTNRALLMRQKSSLVQIWIDFEANYHIIFQRSKLKRIFKSKEHVEDLDLIVWRLSCLNHSINMGFHYILYMGLISSVAQHDHYLFSFQPKKASIARI